MILEALAQACTESIVGVSLRKRRGLRRFLYGAALLLSAGILGFACGVL